MHIIERGSSSEAFHSWVAETEVERPLLQLPIYDAEGRQDRYRQEDTGDASDAAARENSEKDD